MDKKDQIILQQLDVIRSMTENNVRRMGGDFWGTPFQNVGKAPAAPEKPAEPEAPARLKHASDNLASLDYTMWDVRLADGTVRTLDSVAGTWA